MQVAFPEALHVAGSVAYCLDSLKQVLN